jgi:hypothetical protein
VTDGGGDRFSFEAADGVRFTVLSRPLTGAEFAELAQAEEEAAKIAAAPLMNG